MELLSLIPASQLSLFIAGGVVAGIALLFIWHKIAVRRAVKSAVDADRVKSQLAAERLRKRAGDTVHRPIEEVELVEQLRTGKFGDG